MGVVKKKGYNTASIQATLLKKIISRIGPRIAHVIILIHKGLFRKNKKVMEYQNPYQIINGTNQKADLNIPPLPTLNAKNSKRNAKI